MMYAKFGKPQDLCGGTPAHGYTIVGRNGQHKTLMESEYVCISQTFINAMKETYPNAWVDHVSFKDERGNNSSAIAGNKEIYSIFCNLAKSANADKYGISLQKDIEDLLESGVAALHDAMTRGISLKALAEDRFREEHQKGLEKLNGSFVGMTAAR
jgi:hypothetical protein